MPDEMGSTDDSSVLARQSERTAPGFLPAACYGAAGAELGNGQWTGFVLFLAVAIALTALGVSADRHG